MEPQALELVRWNIGRCCVWATISYLVVAFCFFVIHTAKSDKIKDSRDGEIRLVIIIVMIISFSVGNCYVLEAVRTWCMPEKVSKEQVSKKLIK